MAVFAVTRYIPYNIQFGQVGVNLLPCLGVKFFRVVGGALVLCGRGGSGDAF